MSESRLPSTPDPLTDGGVPSDFDHWSPEAKRAWLAGAMTQRQMLNYAALELGLESTYGGIGPLSNKELARFVVELTDPMVGDTL